MNSGPKSVESLVSLLFFSEHRIRRCAIGLLIGLALVSRGLLGNDGTSEIKLTILKTKERGNCLALLQRLQNSATTEPGPVLAIGSWESLGPALIESGVAPSVAQQFQVMVQSIALQKQAHEILSYALKEISDPRQQERLFVCISDRRCWRNGAEAAFSNYGVNYNFVPFDKAPTAVQKLSAVQPVPDEALARLVNAIMIPVPDFGREDSAAHAVSAFFHELTHFADLNLMSRWIRANERLIELGQTADPLFRQVVRKREGMYEIDERFKSVFMETRAYDVGSETYWQLVPKWRVRDLVDRLVMEGLAQVRREGGESLLEEFGGATPETFFTLGRELGRLMNQTIERAAAR